MFNQKSKLKSLLFLCLAGVISVALVAGSLAGCTATENGQAAENGQIGEDVLTGLIAEAKEALAEEYWSLAGQRLAEAAALPESEENPFMEAIAKCNAIAAQVDIIDALQKGRVVTAEQVLSDLEELAELCPPDPAGAILEQEPRELYSLFLTLWEWRVKLLNFPSDKYFGELVLEEGFNEIFSLSEKYLARPVTSFPFNQWDAEGAVFYYAAIGSPGLGLSDGDFYCHSPGLVDAAFNGNSVKITLEAKEKIEVNTGDVLEPGRYQLVYAIHFQDDGSFRVGDCEILDLQTGEILAEVDIAYF